MRRPIPCLFPFAMVTVAACVVEAGTLEVGPGRKYARPSEAIGAAKDGDVVEIDSAGSYGGDVATIRANRLTIRGVGAGRVKLPAEGHHAGGKAIWIAAGDDITVENIEFSGPIPLTNHPKAEEAGNIVLESVAEARLADPARYDYRLQADSPAIDKGVEPGKAGEISLVPEFQYVHPAKAEKRPDHGKIDVGAYEFAKGK